MNQPKQSLSFPAILQNLTALTDLGIESATMGEMEIVKIWIGFSTQLKIVSIRIDAIKQISSVLRSRQHFSQI